MPSLFFLLPYPLVWEAPSLNEITSYLHFHHFSTRPKSAIAWPHGAERTRTKKSSLLVPAHRFLTIKPTSPFLLFFFFSSFSLPSYHTSLNLTVPIHIQSSTCCFWLLLNNTSSTTSGQKWQTMLRTPPRQATNNWVILPSWLNASSISRDPSM